MARFNLKNLDDNSTIIMNAYIFFRKYYECWPELWIYPVWLLSQAEQRIIAILYFLIA